MKIASLDPSAYRPPRLHVTRDVSTSLVRSVATDVGSLSVVSSFQYGDGGPEGTGHYTSFESPRLSVSILRWQV